MDLCYYNSKDADSILSVCLFYQHSNLLTDAAVVPVDYNKTFPGVKNQYSIKDLDEGYNRLFFFGCCPTVLDYEIIREERIPCFYFTNKDSLEFEDFFEVIHKVDTSVTKIVWNYIYKQNKEKPTCPPSIIYMEDHVSKKHKFKESTLFHDGLKHMVWFSDPVLSNWLNLTTISESSQKIVTEAIKKGLEFRKCVIETASKQGDIY